MAVQTFNVRVQHKKSTHADWTTENIVPLEGELCIIEVPADAGAVVQEPSILFKVGDGTTAFADLPYVSAKAADVYDWAKAAVKPSYQASEIGGLSDYISGAIQDSDTQYKLEQDKNDPHLLKLYSKALGKDWTEAVSIRTADTVYDDTALKGRVAANEAAITVLNGTGVGSVSKQVADAIAKIVADAPEAYDTLKEISDWISTHSTDAAGMNSAINANTADIAALEALVGSLPEGAASKTIVAYISELVNASADTKVDKVAGKGLSTEDFTTALKSKLEAIAAGAQTNTIESIKVNGTAQTIGADKSVDIAVPKGKLADKDAVAEADLGTALATKINGKANSADLSALAKSGNIKDLDQTAGDYIILNCGSATVNI